MKQRKTLLRLTVRLKQPNTEERVVGYQLTVIGYKRVFLRTLKSNAKKVFAWGVFANAEIQCEESISAYCLGVSADFPC